MRHLFTHGPYRGRIATALAFEGGGTNTVVTRALGSRRLRVTITGPGGHSWTDAGTPNPILTLSRALSNLPRLRLPTNPRTTINVGHISGGTSINSIPESATALLDLRSTDPAQLVSTELDVRRPLRRNHRRGHPRNRPSAPHPHTTPPHRRTHRQPPRRRTPRRLTTSPHPPRRRPPPHPPHRTPHRLHRRQHPSRHRRPRPRHRHRRYRRRHPHPPGMVRPHRPRNRPPPNPPNPPGHRPTNRHLIRLSPRPPRYSASVVAACPGLDTLHT